MSQVTLAKAVGVTFQQIQKYEKATSRIGAGRLQQISEALQVSVSYFFDVTEVAPDYPQAQSTLSVDISTFLSSSEGLLFARAIGQIKDRELLRRIRRLVEVIATDS